MKHFLFIAFLFLISTVTAQAEKRVALVIGNSAYQHVAELKNPYNDANAMTEKLEALGFEVVSGVDLDLRAMRRTFRQFVGKLDQADLALFFYAGHGLQVHGENYLVPVDAELGSHLDLDFETFPANLILNAMEDATDINLVFLDACRNNPFTRNLARSMGTRSAAVGRGLAKIGSGVGSLISFATQPGNVALDGDGENSPFTSALVKHLGTPGQDITRDLVLVRRDVLTATKGEQVPWENSSLTGEVILREKSPEPETPKINPQIELTYWDTIKTGQTADYFETYLKRYPDGQFADIAKLRIQEIKAAGERNQVDRQRQDTAAEIAYWQSIQATQRPEMLESYLARYPGGIYTDLARLKLDALKQTIAENKKKGQPESSIALNAPSGTVAPTAETGTDQQLASLTPEATRADVQEPAAAEVDETQPALTERELARAMQTELNRLGCSVGGVDGVWGKRSRNALKLYAKETKIELASLDPSPTTLDGLKQSTGRICPLTCSRNQELKNGKCVAIKRETPAGSGTNTQKATQSAGNCPSNPTAYGNKIIGRVPTLGRPTLSHPCGRKLTCWGSKSSWNLTCKWI